MVAPQEPLTVVVALGGNAILKPGQRGTIYEQFANVRAAMEPIVRILRYGHRVVLTLSRRLFVAPAKLSVSLTMAITCPQTFGASQGRT